MTEEEKREFRQMSRDIDEIKREIIGSERNEFTDGLAFQFRRLEEDNRRNIEHLEKEISSLKDQSRKVKQLLIGIAIGIGIAGLAFGWVTLKDLIGYIK